MFFDYFPFIFYNCFHTIFPLFFLPKNSQKIYFLYLFFPYFPPIFRLFYFRQGYSHFPSIDHQLHGKNKIHVQSSRKKFYDPIKPGSPPCCVAGWLLGIGVLIVIVWLCERYNYDNSRDKIRIHQLWCTVSRLKFIPEFQTQSQNTRCASLT